MRPQKVKKEKQSKSIIVLGMHRSGTFMTSGILKILGVNIGKNLMGPHWSNPFGHFENWEFVKLNDQILEAAGGSWNRPPEKENILAQKERFSLQIRNLIQREKSEIWGWKDPRTSLTIELYLPYLENHYFVVCYREPLNIAKSLKRRDGMEIDEGLRLTAIYNQRIKEFFEKYPDLKRIDLFYEDIVTNPDKWLKILIDFLEIKPTKAQFQEALSFVSPRGMFHKLSVKKKEKLSESFYHHACL
ncbi:MAG: sulfotransferase [Candidatus Desulfofervidaceae bacterium]|nr:sulfotransferase [Candidatus Desulfofervidaceae bacterium]